MICIDFRDRPHLPKLQAKKPTMSVGAARKVAPTKVVSCHRDFNLNGSTSPFARLGVFAL
jgi:hypothetical protein